MKTILFIYIFLLVTLAFSILQWVDVVHLPCVADSCTLGGICAIYNKNKVCLNGRNVNVLCTSYCPEQKCAIGVGRPIRITCE